MITKQNGVTVSLPYSIQSIKFPENPDPIRPNPIASDLWTDLIHVQFCALSIKLDNIRHKSSLDLNNLRCTYVTATHLGRFVWLRYVIETKYRMMMTAVWQWQRKQCKYVCITTNQPGTKSNPNPNSNPHPTTKQHVLVNIQLNTVACHTYSEKFIYTRQRCCTVFTTCHCHERISL